MKPDHPEPKESLPVFLRDVGEISVRRGCNAKKSFCWYIHPFIPDAESIIEGENTFFGGFNLVLVLKKIK